MKTRSVKLRYAPDLHIDASVNVDTGRAVVVIDSDDPLVEDITMTPAEALRFAEALTKAATVCRGKEDHSAPPRVS